jgi:hypothetical protein
MDREGADASSGGSDGAFGDGASFEEAPELDEEPARERNDADGSHAAAAVGEATFEPAGELGVGLEADPAPSDLDDSPL